MLQLNWKAAATVVTGATALAGWLATPSPPAREPARSTARRAAVPVPASLEHEASRLAVRIRGTRAFAEPSRNPFQFQAVAPTGRAAVPEAAPGASPAAAAPAAPVFPFRLAGTASDESSGTTVRTAVLSSSTLGLVLAKVGEVVANTYRVERIDDDGVEVVDVRDGRVIRLTLGP